MDNNSMHRFSGKPGHGLLLLLLAAVLTSPLLTAGANTADSLEQANLEKALYCMEILEDRPDLEPDTRVGILREECFSEDYIQHSPHVPDGREAVLEIFTNRYRNYPEISTSIKRTASDGDLVWIHQHVQRSADDRGRAVVNIFRMENGRFAEHWNVVQPVPEESRNDNTMF